MSEILTSPRQADRYAADLKEELTGRRDACFVWLCNFEVEQQWARGHVGLPTVKLSTTTSTVHRMEQLGALLADPGDHLLLGQALDPGYRDYVESIGFAPPMELLAPDVTGAGTTAAVLASHEVRSALRRLGEQGAYLMPMGCSADEQKIAEATGIRPAVPDAAVFERVNSKIYSRHLVEELGLRAIPGHCCESVADLRAALGPSAMLPVIVKEAYGVSGKGLVVLDSEKKVARLLRMVEQRSRRTGDVRLDVVVESFLAKRSDLNYQFTVGRTGRVRLNFVKEALTAHGVHMGHIMPADLTAAQYAEIESVAMRIGERLHADGFVGVVGVDALLGVDDLIYPVLEINARLNMSSYQGRVTERFLRPGHCALAKYHPLRLAARLPWSRISVALGDLLEPPVDGTGMVVTCFGTVNAQAQTAQTAQTAAPFNGRLYSVLFAPDRAALAALDSRITDALSVVEAGGE